MPLRGATKYKVYITHRTTKDLLSA